MQVALAAAWALGLFVSELGVGASFSVARAAERQVLVIVTCDSYADLKKQLGWMGMQVGQPGLAGMMESVLLMATQGRGLGGLDVKRPLGAVVTTDGNDLAVHGFVPVKSLDKLLDSLQSVTGPVERSGNSRSLTLPSGIALDLVEENGWAIVSPQGVDVEAVDPTLLFAPLSENYTIGIQAFPHLLPEPLRLQLRMLVEQGAAAAGEQGQQLDARTIGKVIDSLADTESLAIGVAIDTEKDRVFIENRTVAVPGSPAALAMQGADQGQLTVAMPPMADGKRPAVSAHLVQRVPEAARREVLSMLEQALPRTQQSSDRLTETLSLLLRDVISSVLATGGIDAAVCIDTTAGANKTALPDVTAGIRVKDGAAVEKNVKTSLSSEVSLPTGVRVTFDAAKVGTANLHTISIDLSGTEAATRLGKNLELTLAITPEYAFLLAGGDPRQRLAALLGPQGRTDPDAKPIAAVEVAVDRVLAYAAEQEMRGVLDVATGDADAGDATEAGAGDQKGSLLKILVRPIERGVATRISADGGVVRAVAAGASAAAGAGAAVPPGLPLPNGFQIPAPAR